MDCGQTAAAPHDKCHRGHKVVVAEFSGKGEAMRWPSSARRSASSRDLEGFDPEEPIVAHTRGPHATPWHPSNMGHTPPVYKLCVLGGRLAGKSAMAYRLTSRSFSLAYEPTRCSSQLFATYGRGAEEALIEIEDTAGVPMGGGAASIALDALLRPLMWFEKRRRERDEEPPAALQGPDPLANAIATARKRMGFIVAAGVDSAAAFELAHAIIVRTSPLKEPFPCKRRTPRCLPCSGCVGGIKTSPWPVSTHVNTHSNVLLLLLLTHRATSTHLLLAAGPHLRQSRV